MLTELLLVKVGGGATINVPAIVADLCLLPGPVIVVHGANAERDALASRLGYQTRVVTSEAGFDSVYSDDRAIELLMLAYAGLANKRLVECFQRAGRNAIGLSGLDGRTVTARRSKGFRVREGDKTLVVRDRSGKPDAVNAALIGLLLGHGYTPVITVPLADETGAAVNAENDEVVAVLADALGATRVIQLIEAPGLLADPAEPASVVARLTPVDLALLEQRATGRFKRKLYALGKLFRNRSPVVTIADGRGAHPVADALAGKGTVIAVA